MKNTDIFEGEKIRFILGKRIGSGGNGDVYEIVILNSSVDINEEAVVKFLHIDFGKRSKWEKRYKRFKREAEGVGRLQTESLSIIPILDAYLPDEMPASKFGAWYIMPRAVQYDCSRRRPVERINDVLQIGYTLSYLHSKGICHRDLKPENILWYKNRPCLSDFGLIRYIEDDETQLTEDGESIGPKSTRPPEFEEIDLDALTDYDYRTGDVYMYGKTSWMVLHGDNSVFLGSYSDGIGLGKLTGLFQGVSLEPLREFFFESTQYRYSDRISIDECIKLIQKQIGLIQGDINQVDIFRYEINKNIRKEIDTGSGYSCTEIDKSIIRKILSCNYKLLNMDIIPYGYEKEDDLIKGQYCLCGYHDNADGSMSLQITQNVSLRFSAQSMTIYNRRRSVVCSIMISDLPVVCSEEVYSSKALILNALENKQYILQPSHVLVFSIKIDQHSGLSQHNMPD